MEFARQSPPVKSNVVSHGRRSSARGEQWDTVSVRLLAVSTGPVSGTGKGIHHFARSFNATSLLSPCQELSLPVASKDRGTSAACRADFYLGPSSSHLKWNSLHLLHTALLHIQMHSESTSSALTGTAAPAQSCYIRPTASREANFFSAHLRNMVVCFSSPSQEQMEDSCIPLSQMEQHLAQSLTSGSKSPTSTY